MSTATTSNTMATASGPWPPSWRRASSRRRSHRSPRPRAGVDLAAEVRRDVEPDALAPREPLADPLDLRFDELFEAVLEAVERRAAVRVAIPQR